MTAWTPPGRRVLVATASVCALTLAVACSDGPSGPPPFSLTVSVDTITLLPTDSLVISAFVSGGDPVAGAPTVRWSSSNSSVITIDETGLAVGMAPGEATVTAAVTGASASTSITVIQGQLGDNAIVADGSLTLTSDSAQAASGMLEFQNNGNVQVEVGDILIGSGNEGYVRRVQTVTSAGQTLTVQTESATLADAMEELAMDVAGEFSLEEAYQAYALAGPSMAPSMPQGVSLQPDGSIRYDNAGFGYTLLGNAGGSGNVRVTLNGSLNVLFGGAALPGASALKITGKIKGFSLKRFTVKSTARLVFNASATAVVTGSPNGRATGRLVTPGALTPKVVLTKRPDGTPGTTCTTVGPIPVCYRATLLLPAYVEVTADLPGTFTNSVSVDIGAIAGGKYRKGSWSPIFFRFGPGATVSSLSEEPGGIQVRYGVLPQLEVKFYEFAGPFIGFDAHAIYSARHETYEWVTGLDAGLDLIVGLRASVFGINLAQVQFNQPLWSTTVAEARGPIASLQVTPKPAQITVGETLQLAAQATRLADGANLGTPSALDWATADAGIASIDTNGRVTGVAVGSVQVGARITGTSVIGLTGVTVVPEPFVSVSPLSITAMHTVGVTACPQPLGNVTIRNVTDESVTWTLTENTALLIREAPGFGTLQPGASTTVGVSFTCSAAQTFTKNVTVRSYKVSNSDDKRVVVIPVTVTVTFPM